MEASSTVEKSRVVCDRVRVKMPCDVAMPASPSAPTNTDVISPLLSGSVVSRRRSKEGERMRMSPWVPGLGESKVRERKAKYESNASTGKEEACIDWCEVPRSLENALACTHLTRRQVHVQHLNLTNQIKL
jgi:hypothetical protein